MSADAQHIEERLMSPQCYEGQHETCKRSLSFIGEDGISRSMVCPCRCHDRAPVAGSSEHPEILYMISWEYEVTQEQPPEMICTTHASGTCDGTGPACAPAKRPRPALRAWISRKVITTSKELAGDWLDSIVELGASHGLRNVLVMKAKVGNWEKVEVKS